MIWERHQKYKGVYGREADCTSCKRHIAREDVLGNELVSYTCDKCWCGKENSVQDPTEGYNLV